MRVLALDLGERRVGVAVSDPSGRVATPREVVDASEVRRLAPSFVELVREVEPDLLLVGLPLTLLGEEGPQAHRVRSQAGQIAKALGLPLEFQDERLSSEEASRRMGEAGLTERERRGRLDALAASIFLQTWLDDHAERGEARP